MSEIAKDRSTAEFRRLFEHREDGLRHFEQWEAKNPMEMSAQTAWSGLALLYDLLPSDSRTRPVDTTGVRRLHRALAGLGIP